MLAAVAKLSLARVYGQAISLLTLFLSTRMLGPEGRGSFAVVLSWVGLFVAVFGWSIGAAMQHRLQDQVRPGGIRVMFGTVWWLGIAMSALGCGVMAGLYLASEGKLVQGIEPRWLLVGFLLCPLFIWEHLGSYLGAAAGHPEAYSRALYVGRSAGVIAFVALVAGLGLGVLGAIWSAVIAQAIIAAMLLAPLVRRLGAPVVASLTEAGKLLRTGSKVHPTCISAVLADQAILLIANQYIPKADIGELQLALQLAALLLLVPQSALLVLYAGLAMSTPGDFWPEQRRLSWRVIGAVSAGAATMFVLAPWLIAVVAGQAFARTAVLLQWILPTLLGHTLSILMTPQWIGRGLFLLNNALNLLVAGVAVAGSWWLIPRFGLDGAVAVRLLTFCLLVPMVQFAFWRWCSAHSPATPAAR